MLAAAPGCGLGAGESQAGRAELVVSRDHGAERLLSATVENPTRSETVTRFLDREAEVEMSYGGNFVESIEGIAGGSGPGGREDWFFYVNGYWSPVGAAEAEVRSGDRIWWDYRRWQAAYRVPVVVGSWPAPFASAPQGERPPTSLDCRAAAVCETVRRALRAAGARIAGSGRAVGESLRVLVGRRQALRGDPDAALLIEGPGESGVYVEPAGEGGPLVALDDGGEPAPGAMRVEGLIAAVRRGERPATWIVTGESADGLRMAVESLDAEALADRYALAIDPDGEVFGLPVVGP